MTPNPTLASPAPQSITRPRLDSVDLLRGLIMVLMALDHVRDFFTNVPFDPLDLRNTTPALFFTRWITHLCAPTFAFLAGTGAFLAMVRGKTKTELSWFLLSRGLWLALLEVTWVRCFGWEFNFNYHSIAFLTLWAIGWSMVTLSVLVFLPTWMVTTFGIVLIAGHNAFDWVKPDDLGSLGWLWTILHVSKPLPIAPGYRLIAGYPLVPWIGVAAVGFGFGTILLREPGTRRKLIFRLGMALTFLFVALRFSNLYGNSLLGASYHWSAQKSFLFTILSFLDCHKQPPSLLYVLMTLGPALIALSFLDRGTPRVLKPILVFGRVPLFYYLIHLPLIHALAWLVTRLRLGHAEWLFVDPSNVTHTPDNGFGLPVVYFVWICVVAALYPLCCWFAEVKRRRRDAWLSYL